MIYWGEKLVLQEGSVISESGDLGPTLTFASVNITTWAMAKLIRSRHRYSSRHCPVLCLHTLSKVTLYGNFFSFRFTGEKTEAQGSEIICLRSHRDEISTWVHINTKSSSSMDLRAHEWSRLDGICGLCDSGSWVSKDCLGCISLTLLLQVISWFYTESGPRREHQDYHEASRRLRRSGSRRVCGFCLTSSLWPTDSTILADVTGWGWLHLYLVVV